MMMARRLALVVLTVPTVLLGGVAADMILSDDFRYPDGALAGNDGGTGWGWEWENTGSGTVDVVDGAASLTYTIGAGGGFQSHEAKRWAGDWYGDDEPDIWLRATVQKTKNNGSNYSFGGIGFYADEAEAGLLGDFWTGDSQTANIWAAGRGDGIVESAGLAVTDLSDVIAHINYASGEISVWINADPSKLGDPDFIGSGIGVFNVIRLRGGSDASGTESWTFDNLLLGTSASDVGIGDAPSCPGDFNDDGEVNGADFGSLLAAWGPCEQCTEDINGDGEINGADVGLMLAYWGPCSNDPCEGIDCDDGDPCTADSCVDGTCVHEPIDCDDFDPCTVDACLFGKCVHQPIDGCFAECGDPDSGSCQENNGTPGCDDAACCSFVCNLDPYCCETSWDVSCVELAKGCP